MQIFLAKTAGFCFGVERAVSCVYENAKKDKIYTYGPIIHNKNVIEDFKKKGVSIIEDLKEVKGKVIIRSHGVPPCVYKTLEEKNIEYIDCTCPFVKKIHKIVLDEYKNKKQIIIIGNSEHPEIIGINGFCENTAIIANDVKDLNIDKNKQYALVFQTTYDTIKSLKIIEYIKDFKNIKLYNTICSATNERQKEVIEIAKKVDYMIVLGDKLSSNTKKLYEISKLYCEKTYLCERIEDLVLNIFSKNVKIGITAGASTPSAIIKEAIYKMKDIDNMSFEEMLNESFKTLHTGSVVKGTVIRVNEKEVVVDLKYKSEGIIEKSEFSNDDNINLKECVSVGDELEVYVVKLNDGDGNVVLSKKKVEANKNFLKLEQAFKDKEVITGKVVEAIKGGLIANVDNIRVFIPSSQISNKFVKDLDSFVGKELDFHIIEFNRARRRIVASRRELMQAKEDALKDEVYAKLKKGDEVKGVVNRIVSFGAFVDLGGVDGLVHISELSWTRVNKVTDVLKVGDEVSAVVLDIDKEKDKIALTLKKKDKDPWYLAKDKYKLHDTVEGKVVRIVDFGAFIELEEGIDALVHISQISKKHVTKVEDVLEIGQVVKAKIIEIDLSNKKISLSIKDADNTFED